MQFSPETTQRLDGFLSNRESLATFYAWVVSASDDSDLPEPEREALAELRLLVLEFDEGLRPLDDARQWVGCALSETSASGQIPSNTRRT